MKKKFKLLSLIAISSALCFVVTALSIASTSIFKPLEYQERNAVVNSSVTFNNFTNNQDGKAESIKSLGNGGTIRAYSTTGANSGAVISSSEYLFFAYVNNGVENKSISVGGSSREMCEFQDISSIKVNYSGSGVAVYYSNNGTNWQSANLFNNFTNSSVDGAKYIYLTGTGNAVLTTVLVNYTCNYAGVPVLDSISLSGDYETAFDVGEEFSSSGLVVIANYTEGKASEVVTSSAIISSPDMSSAGSKTVEVSYTEGNITKTTSYQITVRNASGGLSGIYNYYVADAVAAYFDFDTNTFIRGSYQLYFDYAISGTTLTFTYVGDNKESFVGSYYLFNPKTSATTNSTGLVISDTSFSVVFYGSGGGATSPRTFTKV